LAEGRVGHKVSVPRWWQLPSGAAKARFLVIALAAAAVGVAVIEDGGSASRAAPLRLEFAYSPDTDELLAPLIARFNHSTFEVRGRSIRIDGRAVTSGEAERMIAAGTLKPVIWGPASSLWGRLLNADVRKEWVPLDNPSIVQSPQVIAMPEQTARKLGWPKRSIGWKDIPRLEASGAFRFGHPNPTTSTSGLSAVAAEYYAVTGKLAGLTIDDVNHARRDVRKIEQSIVHYAPKADDLLKQLARYGPGYASAVVVQETSLVQFNEQSPWRLVAVYPTDGTFIADYPYIVLDGPWVNADDRVAAHTFERWLRTHVTPEAASRSGYRVATPGAPVLPPVDPQHGADPSKPDVVLRPPAPDVLTAILAGWREDRRPADVVLAVDASASMGKAKTSKVRGAIGAFLESLPRRDRVGLTTFDDHVTTVVPLARLAANEHALRNTLASSAPGGRRALYEAIAEGVRQVASSDATRTAALVVVTDGKDDASSLDLHAMLRRLRGTQVRIFTVALGGEADRDALAKIAATSRGKAFTTSAEDLADTYREIALFL
jgi:Ca-activated chloride channel family protein